LRDLNLPGTDGREVLATIKHDGQLCQIPVIVLTSSEDAHDIGGCYAAGANSYMKKPVDFEAFMQVMQRFKDYWFEVVILSKAGHPSGSQPRDGS
jgi:CheY-like chemotaxis protein